MNRRDLVKTLGAAGIASALPFSTFSTAFAKEKLNILFMGGTGFIGPHMVRALLAQGHTVTLFNRGKSNPGLFDELEKIQGDRNTADIEQVSGRKWDVIVDSSCYLPRSVDLLMAAVDKSHLQHYVFISTISVYADFSKPGLTEESPLATMDDDLSSEDVGKYYGALKVRCEQAAETALPGKVTKVRCGLIIGPGDSTDRFTYWPERVFQGGEMLAPGTGEDYLQTIDARDLADWVAHCVDNKVVGAYNATNPPKSYSLKTILDICKKKINPDTKLTWVPVAFLEEQKVQAMADLPLWVPADNPMMGGIWYTDSSKAAANGLKNRPLAESIVDTHEWFQTLPEERRNKRRAGMSLEREKEVLDAWHAQQKAAGG